MNNELKPGVLYIVGTPIGNLGDVSERALETLRTVDFIAAEDTRVTIKLLNRFGIKKPMMSYYQHNAMARSQQILDRIIAGESCALVSDAGMPAISDPGELLVKMAHEQSVQTLVIPGPSALISALALSGMPSGRFTFEGFLSVNKSARRKHLEELRFEPRTMIFYEAPHKLIATLRDMEETFSDREICLCRELTKLHEQCINTTFSKAIELYEESSPKGEFVLIVSGCKADDIYTEIDVNQVVESARKMMESGMPASAAAKEAAKDTPFSKSEVYRLLMLDGDK